jgi:hypothetical protein
MSTPAPTCTHARANGDGCKALAMNGKILCYFHQRELDRRLRIERNHDYRRNRINTGYGRDLYKMLPDGQTLIDDNSAALFNALQLPSFEDADGIQIALSAIFRALATRQIEHRTARLMLADLKIAARNLKNVQTPYRDTKVYQESDNAPLPEVPDVSENNLHSETTDASRQ